MPSHPAYCVEAGQCSSRRNHRIIITKQRLSTALVFEVVHQLRWMAVHGVSRSIDIHIAMFGRHRDSLIGSRVTNVPPIMV